MEDFLGNEIVVGDKVVTLAKNYRGLVKAKILSISEKSLLVEYLNTWNYGANGRLETYRVTGSMVIKTS